MRWVMAAWAAAAFAAFFVGWGVVREPNGVGDWTMVTSEANEEPRLNSVNVGAGVVGVDVREWNSAGRGEGKGG